MKVFIKSVMNGWLVRYQVFDNDDRLRGEKEKAFTYVLEDEKKKEEAWRRVEGFVAGKFIDWELHKKMYPFTYDEEKEEWVGNEEFERRRDESGEIKRLRKGGNGSHAFCGSDFIFSGWGIDKISKLTQEQWEVNCAKLVSKRLHWHFGENDSMSYEQYVEIKDAAVKEFTKKFGLQPKDK